jgi:hypothetical protein
VIDCDGVVGQCTSGNLTFHLGDLLAHVVKGRDLGGCVEAVVVIIPECILIG